jgi:hypothetical protein
VTRGEGSAAPNGQADAYLLRDLIWCELCDRAMRPLLIQGTRYYECENEQCPRPMPAREIELLLWQQYILLFEGTDAVVPTQVRRAALRRKLARVRVGEDIFEFWCDWKD